MYATASAKGSTPTITQRQTAWANFESDPLIRIRLTDSTTQSDLASLGTSCNNASLINNKQVGFGGLAVGSSKSTLQSAAAAIASKRFVLVGPSIYDENGVLRSGAFSAAAVAAEAAKNSDIADDLDLFTIPGITGIEYDSVGQPLFRERVVSGSVVNDFEDLLQSGVSPLQRSRQGVGAQITHLRTTYTTDTTFDALMTRLIIDQVFIDVRDYCINTKFLRRGNTPQTRNDLAAGVEALLTERVDWIQPITQSNGRSGYNVSAQPSADGRAIYLGYEGIVVRGVQTIRVDARLSIPV